MKSKYYALAGLRLRVDSEKEIDDSRLYEAFYAPPGDCDIRILLSEGPLPAPKGRLMYRTSDREYYSCEDDIVLVSSFPRQDGPVPFACRQGTGGEIALTVDYPKGLWDSMLFHALNLPELLAERGVFLLHSSFVLYRGEALLFSGDKGAGKSTQAALWERYRGARLVNGDRSLLAFRDERLTAYGTPYRGSSDVALALSAPVKAIAFPERASRNAAERCVGAASFARLLPQLTYEAYQRKKAVDFLSDVCAGTPVYKLRCLPKKSAVTLLENTIWNE
ncbi:MAG: hypothetical protein IJK89_11125 [Clostridia bacterium]|nr:hypothetical protein [Clostridia bacterium]